MHRSRRLSMVVVGALVAVMTVGLAGPANASTGFVDNWSNKDLRISTGLMSVYDDTIEWSFNFYSTNSLPQGKCAHLYVQVDVNNGKDPVYPSQSVCGPNAVGGVFRGGPVTHDRVRNAFLVAIGPSGWKTVIIVNE
jgi:hypothetical protein